MSNKLKGLTQKQVEESRNQHGTNELVKIKGKGIARRFFENLSDPIIRILIAALALQVLFTFGNCNLIEVFGIVAAILIATTVSTLSEYGSERTFSKIESEAKESKVIAIRDGKKVAIGVSDVVVGDVLLLRRGEKVQADGTVLDGDILVDQSALNGENTEARKRKCASASFFFFLCYLLE